MDAIFKGIQEIYINRSTQNEHFLQKLDYTQSDQKLKDFLVPNTESAFEQFHGKAEVKAFFHSAFKPQMALLYIFMIVMFLFLIIMNGFGN